MNLVKKVWAALKLSRPAGLKFRTLNVEPCAYCGADEPASWLDLNRKYACKSAYLFCPCCGQDGPKASSLDEAKAYWDAAQYAEIARLRKLAPACFEEVAV